MYVYLSLKARSKADRLNSQRRFDPFLNGVSTISISPFCDKSPIFVPTNSMLKICEMLDPVSTISMTRSAFRGCDIFPKMTRFEGVIFSKNDRVRPDKVSPENIRSLFRDNLGKPIW